MPGTASKRRLLVDLALGALLVAPAAERLAAAYRPPQSEAAAPDNDFFQYWVVGAVARLAAEPVGNPYLEPRAYLDALPSVARAQRPPDRRFHGAWRSRARHFNLNQTPLLFAIFGQLPLQFRLAADLYATLQLLSGAAALALLSRASGLSGRALGLVAIGGLAVYRPAWADLEVGNTNLVQLLGIALFVALADRLRPGRRARSVAFWAALAAFVLFKPTLCLVAAALALLVLRRLPVREALVALVVAAPIVPVLMAWSAANVGSSPFWGDWLGVVFRHGRGGVGRVATLRLLASAWPGIPWLAVLGGGLALSLAARLVWLRRAQRRASPGAAALVALSLAATLALAPMVWWHYHVLLLAPALLLLGSGRAASRLGILSLLLASLGVGLLGQPSPALESLALLLSSSSWLPMWLAGLWALGAESGRAEGAVPAGDRARLLVLGLLAAEAGVRLVETGGS